MRKLRVVFENCRASDTLDVIDRGRETDRARDIRCAGFKSVGRFLKRAFFQSDADNHFAAAVPWRDRIQNRRPSVKRADASRATHFVSGEGEEIAAQLLHVDGHMSHALRRVHQRERADRVRFGAEFGDRIDCAEGV